MYLLTCPHCNLIGCFYAPLSYLAGDLGWDAERVRHHLDLLQKRRFLFHCPNSDWLLLRHYLKYNPIENPNQGKAAFKLLASIPKGFKYRHMLRKAIEPYQHRLPIPSSSELPPNQSDIKSSSQYAPVSAIQSSTQFQEFWTLQIRKEKKVKAEEVWEQLGLNENTALAKVVTTAWLDQKSNRLQYQDKV